MFSFFGVRCFLNSYFSENTRQISFIELPARILPTKSLLFFLLLMGFFVRVICCVFNQSFLRFFDLKNRNATASFSDSSEENAAESLTTDKNQPALDNTTVKAAVSQNVATVNRDENSSVLRFGSNAVNFHASENLYEVNLPTPSQFYISNNSSLDLEGIEQASPGEISPATISQRPPLLISLNNRSTNP